MAKVKRYLKSNIKNLEEEAKRKRGRPPRARNQDVSDWNGLGPYRCIEDVEGYDIDTHENTKLRSCLRCCSEFKSLNNGNRICHPCASTKDMSESKFSMNLKGSLRPISDWTLINLYEPGSGSESSED